jgi:RNA polymerase sigma factor (sigma-70 family)
MIVAPRPTLLQHLRRLIGCPRSASVPDQQLLERFLNNRDDAAFELLVWRHGPMVLNVCGRVLNDDHLAEDAFQATFLKLARKAASITDGESISSWLYKVAFRTALRTQEQAQHHSQHEQPLGDLPVTCPGPGPDDEAAWRELRPVLDEEVRRLPEIYRSVFILCCLQGLTNEQAAQELGCPKGTVLSRLARARERLRKRLSRRGLAVGLMLPFLLTRCGERALSPELVAWALQKVSAAIGSVGVKTAAGTGLLGGPAALAIALGALLALGVTGTAAYFYAQEGGNGPGKHSGGGGGSGCHQKLAPIAPELHPAQR